MLFKSKIPTHCFMELEKLILNFLWERQDTSKEE